MRFSNALSFIDRIWYSDKLISDDLAYKLIDQAPELKIPSIKFNWRGEPLMHLDLKVYFLRKRTWHVGNPSKY